MEEHDIVVQPDGTIQFIYVDDLAETFEGEILYTKRASHVEPFGQGWIADMRPSDGPILFDIATTNPIGRVAFRTRQQALDAERDWLRREKGL